MTNPLVFNSHQRDSQPAMVPVLPRPGDATRLTVNAMGHSTGAPPRGQTFNHPFRPFLGSFSLTFRLGTVQSLAGAGPIIPSITVGGKLVPMIDPKTSAAAQLDLSKVKPTADDLSYAVLQVTPDDATGELLATSKCEIIHTTSPISHARTFGRCPLALILWSGASPIYVYPLVHFNLRYLRLLPAAGAVGIPKHLFL